MTTVCGLLKRYYRRLRPQAVNQYIAGGNLRAVTSFSIGYFNSVAIIANKDVFRFHSNGFGELGVSPQHAVLTMNRDEVLGTNQIEHQFQIFLVTMTGHVNPFWRIGVVHHICSDSEQLVYRTCDEFLVSRNRCGCDDDGIAWKHFHLPVGSVRHACQSGHRFTLASGGDYRHPVGGQPTDIIRIDQQIGRNPQISEFHTDIDDVDHAPTHDSQLATVVVARIHNLLDTVDIGSECSDDNPLLRFSKHFLD